MIEPGHYDRLRDGLLRLLDGLRSWPKSDDIAYVRDFIDHNEFGEALENLIAVGSSNGVGFTLHQWAEIESLARSMDICISGNIHSESKNSE